MFRLSGSPLCIRGMLPVRGNPFCWGQKTVEAAKEKKNLTSGFSWRRALKVENNRGFIVVDVSLEMDIREHKADILLAAASAPRFRP